MKYIDVVESDHAPHTKEEKNVGKQVFGVPGLETTLPLLLTAVSEKRLSIDDVVRLCHSGPKECFHVSIHHNTKIEVDLDEEWIVIGRDLQTKCKWTPFENWPLKGRIKRVIMRGRVVFENGQVMAQAGSGSVVFPNAL